jgi:hypothetical protein
MTSEGEAIVLDLIRVVLSVYLSPSTLDRNRFSKTPNFLPVDLPKIDQRWATFGDLIGGPLLRHSPSTDDTSLEGQGCEKDVTNQADE